MSSRNGAQAGYYDLNGDGNIGFSSDGIQVGYYDLNGDTSWLLWLYQVSSFWGFGKRP